MADNLIKANRLGVLQARVLEIDSIIKRLDDTAKQSLEGEATVTLEMIAVKGIAQIVQEEYQIPPVFVPGYPPITSIMLPRQTNTTTDRIVLPDSITLSIIGTVVAHYNIERRSIMQEIDSILEGKHARPKSKTKVVPIAKLQQ